MHLSAPHNSIYMHWYYMKTFADFNKNTVSSSAVTEITLNSIKTSQ